MNIPLIHMKSNNSDIHQNISINDIENTSNDTVANRISCDDHDDVLYLILKKNKIIMNFFKISGVYLITDDNDNIIWRLLARIWQISLLLFSSIYVVWGVFVFGSSNADTLNQNLSPSNDDATSLSIFLDLGDMFFSMIVPILQVFSLMYGVYHITKLLLHKPVSSAVIAKVLPTNCRDAIIFYIIIALAGVISSSLGNRPTAYEATYEEGYDDGYLKSVGMQTYSFFAFYRVSVFFYNLTTTGYLSVVMMFVTLEFKEAVLILREAIDSTEKDQLGGGEYMKMKTKILKIRDDSYYFVQILTITSLINLFVFMFQIWKLRRMYDQGEGLTYGLMILYDFYAVPYLFKGTNSNTCCQLLL